MSVVSYSESGWNTQEEDDRWDDWEDDEMNVPMKCLFCTHTSQSTIMLFRHIKQIHGFNFPKVRKSLNLDFYQSMRVVNYIRSLEKADPNFAKVSEFKLDGTEDFLHDDEYLKPVLDEDNLLYALDELDLDDNASVTSSRVGSLSRTPGSSGLEALESLKERELTKRIKTLEHQLGIRDMELKYVADQFDQYKEMVKHQFYDNVSVSDSDSEKGSCTKSSEAPKGDYYFNSYANNDIHLQMLQDKVRTEGYRDFIYDNKDLFKGKVVLDVGCGTGILSMFAARAGAAKVIAVDNSDIIAKAKANVTENKLDGIITLVRGKIEEIEIPVDKVDIIISEWMGYFLLFEAMLDSVLVARDRFLAPGGLLAPSASYIYLTAIQDDDYMNNQVNYWDNVYGFKMTAMKPTGSAEADVDVVPSDAVVATRSLIAEIDHGTTSPKKLDFSSAFTIELTRDAKVHALLGYFDVAFSRSQEVPGPTDRDLNAHVYSDDGGVEPKSLWRQPEAKTHGFTTGPHGTPTHWKQTVFVLDQAVVAKKGDQIRGQFSCNKSKTNPRELDLTITYYHVPAGEVDKVGGMENADGVKQQIFQLR